MPRSHPGPSRRGRFGRVAAIVGTTVVLVLLIQLLVASQIGVPWVAFEPGSATPTEQRVAVNGAQTYDAEGQILFLTVRVNQLTALEWLSKSRDKNVDIERESDVLGNRTPSENRKFNQDLMVRSKSNAELVALSYLGYDVFTSTGVLITNVVDGSAAAGNLSVNEAITAVNGTETPTAQSLVDLLKTTTPGTQVTLDVENGDGSNHHQVTVTLGARPDGSAGGFLGIGTDDRVEEKKDVPVHVNIDSGDVGGNSAGLAFTLAIIDEMTPGSLTGGHKVAVTGTIDLDGTVGDVGGVSQKAVAAKRAGAEYMIVPTVEEEQAKRFVGDTIKVIPVNTLTDALNALSDLGGNARQLALPGAQHTN